MRGKPDKKERLVSDEGITPADAGKTLKVLQRNSLLKDHPRGCGENLSSGRIDTTTSGSPPRMRGKQRFRKEAERENRITPADAGKTLC